MFCLEVIIPFLCKFQALKEHQALKDDFNNLNTQRKKVRTVRKVVRDMRERLKEGKSKEERQDMIDEWKKRKGKSYQKALALFVAELNSDSEELTVMEDLEVLSAKLLDTKEIVAAEQVLQGEIDAYNKRLDYHEYRIEFLEHFVNKGAHEMQKMQKIQMNQAKQLEEQAK